MDPDAEVVTLEVVVDEISLEVVVVVVVVETVLVSLEDVVGRSLYEVVVSVVVVAVVVVGDPADISLGIASTGFISSLWVLMSGTSAS